MKHKPVRRVADKGPEMHFPDAEVCVGSVLEQARKEGRQIKLIVPPGTLEFVPEIEAGTGALLLIAQHAAVKAKIVTLN